MSQLTMLEPGIGQSRQVAFLVDPSMHEDVNAVPRLVYADLEKAVRPDLRYHYSGPICAQRWLDVCDDPAYGHRRLIAAVAELCPCLVAAIRADWPDLSRISVLSLGPGDGSLDESILRGLVTELRIESYYGLDFSFDLLRRAVNRLSRCDALRDVVPITAICGDFTGLAPTVVAAVNGGTRIFALTGLTIGNYREDRLLASLRAMMQPGDYLMLDARLHDLGAGRLLPLRPSDTSRMLASYDIGSVRRFVFGPVEVATLATAEEAEIRFEVSRAFTTVPGALNVVIYCTDLQTRMRLTGDRVHRDRLDLAVTTMYHEPQLSEWFPGQGFSVLWRGAAGALALYLLRRN